MNYMYHFTRDGEYVDGLALRGEVPLNATADAYCGCHVWVLLRNGDWYSKAAAGMATARWDAENATSVPECVRTAELMRGV